MYFCLPFRQIISFIGLALVSIGHMGTTNKTEILATWLTLGWLWQAENRKLIVPL